MTSLTNIEQVQFFTLALEQAQKASRLSAPNPAVGCILVSPSDEVIGQTGPAPGASLLQQLKLVQRHENAHVTFLKTALGSAARPKPTFKNLLQPNFTAFLNTSRALENRLCSFTHSCPRVRASYFATITFSGITA